MRKTAWSFGACSPGGLRPPTFHQLEQGENADPFLRVNEAFAHAASGSADAALKELTSIEDSSKLPGVGRLQQLLAAGVDDIRKNATRVKFSD